MNPLLYNKHHLRDYLLFGTLAGIVYSIPAFIFFQLEDYKETWLVFGGSILFMFVVLFYTRVLAQRKPAYKSTLTMIIAAHLCVLTGIIVSLVITALLCFIYIPHFLSGQSPAVFNDAPPTVSAHNSGIVVLLFVCAVGENLGVGAFAGVLGPYVFKKDQTGDKAGTGNEGL